MNHFLDFQKSFDIHILKYLRKKEDEFFHIDSKAGVLIQILIEFIKQGGKRIRPALFYFAVANYKGNKNNAFMQSMAFEFFHTFCLIHDDLIDQSDLRRGKPTVHIKYDQATAILAGDMALMIADEIFFSFPCSDLVKKTYNHFKQEVLIGQYIDTIGSKDIQKVMDLKTARYSFVRPVELGLQIVGLEKKYINQWKRILYAIGITFQLKDDLIGVFGDQDKIGKSTISDLSEGKYTRLIEFFEKEASLSDKRQFYAHFGKGAMSKTDSKLLKNMLKAKYVPRKIINMILKDAKQIKQDLMKIEESMLHYILRKVLSNIEDMSIIHT